MPFNFPASPTVGQQSTQNGRTYSWTGYAWELVAASSVGVGSDSRWDLFLPAAPTSVTASAGNAQATVSWTAPTGVLAQTPVTDYTVQYSSNSGSSWENFSDGTSTATSATVTGLTNGTAYTFRVAAVNGVGTGSYSSASSAVTPSAFSASAIILTSGTSYTVPTGASSMKAWAVGPGGQNESAVGNAGAVAHKTWSVSGGQSVSYAIGQRYTYPGYGPWSRSGSTTVTFGGTTITAEGGSGGNGPYAAATYSGGDGGADGGVGGNVSGSFTGGAVGGNGTRTSCGRYPATDVSGLFAAVTMAGGNATESCGATAAFGSGGSSQISSLPGIGGGGAWFGVAGSDLGGVGAVVIYFS
jgi:titin